ncbi:DNA repair protein recA homolog 2, mitochondrial [Mercurialis annua]|uniref:DNA repair protein recA homolog 2, mitochondrial n=1 Tax=Mercurialis annua TaxID=3986 RepID=UPI00215F2F4C|nr:DNA repair protein recA homolog 2, mitochondrial [Mercurialis annua]
MVSLRLNILPRFRLCSPLSQNTRKEAITRCCTRMRPRLFCSLANFSDFECDQVDDGSETMEKNAKLLLALKEVSNEFSKESRLSLQGFFNSRRPPVISTGSLKLDLALGIGGLPEGRMVEIYGKEASGKTTLALHIIKEAQKRGGYCAYLDAENALDTLLVESMGVNTENLLISPPDSAENLLCVVDTLTKSGSVDVIVVDSVAALIPQFEVDGVIGNTEDIQSRVMSQAIRKINYSLSHSKTLIVFLNQVRRNVKSEQGLAHLSEGTCGGNALRFYSAIRLRMVRTGLLKTQDKITGVGVSVQVVKNKLAPAMKKADIRIQFGRGFCCESEVLELGCEHGIILREGSTYLIGEEALSNKQAAEEYLAENNGVLDEVVTALRRQLFERRVN